MVFNNQISIVMQNELYLIVGDCPPYRKVAIINDATPLTHGAVRIGIGAGLINQTANAVAIGYGAGSQDQGWSAIAIGWNAGMQGQGQDAVAIGHRAGQENQQLDAIAIGVGSGEFNQGHDSIALGRRAGRHDQAPNSISINATGRELENRNPGTTVIKPMRAVKHIEPGFLPVYYNPETGELVYLDVI
jgi:hypothetical protein